MFEEQQQKIMHNRMGMESEMSGFTHDQISAMDQRTKLPDIGRSSTNNPNSEMKQAV